MMLIIEPPCWFSLCVFVCVNLSQPQKHVCDGERGTNPRWDVYWYWGEALGGLLQWRKSDSFRSWDRWAHQKLKNNCMSRNLLTLGAEETTVLKKILDNFVCCIYLFGGHKGWCSGSVFKDHSSRFRDLFGVLEIKPRSSLCRISTSATISYP